MNEIALRTRWERRRGVIGRYPRDGQRYVFEYDDVAERPIHMVGVFRPLRVTWHVGSEVVKERVLRPLIGHDAAPANRVVEERP